MGLRRVALLAVYLGVYGLKTRPSTGLSNSVTLNTVLSPNDHRSTSVRSLWAVTVRPMAS